MSSFEDFDVDVDVEDDGAVLVILNAARSSVTLSSSALASASALSVGSAEVRREEGNHWKARSLNASLLGLGRGGSVLLDRYGAKVG